MSEEVEFYNQCHRLFVISDGLLIRRISVAPNARAGDVAGNWDKKLNYFRVKINRKSYLVHRVIYLMTNERLPDIIDHRDGDTSNNRPENLREANSCSNRWNCLNNEGSVSGVKGVYYDRGRWRALVNFKGKRYYLGMHSTVESAKLSVVTKYNELQGEFSKENSTGEFK